MCHRAHNSMYSSMTGPGSQLLSKQAYGEIAVSVEVVWSHEHVMIYDGDHNRKNQAALRECPVRSLEI